MNSVSLLAFTLNAALGPLLVCETISRVTYGDVRRDEGSHGGQDGQKKQSSQARAESDGLSLLYQGCVQWHDLKETLLRPRTRAGWRRTVNDMVWRGAPLMPDEAEAIIAYLALEYGPDPSNTKTTPENAGKAESKTTGDAEAGKGARPSAQENRDMICYLGSPDVEFVHLASA